MQKFKQLSALILEAVSYGFFSGIFVLAVLLIKDLTKPPPMPGLSLGYGERGIPPGGVFLGCILSVVFWNLLFGKIIKSNFL